MKKVRLPSQGKVVTRNQASKGPKIPKKYPGESIDIPKEFPTVKDPLQDKKCGPGLGEDYTLDLINLG